MTWWQATIAFAALIYFIDQYLLKPLRREIEVLKRNNEQLQQTLFADKNELDSRTERARSQLTEQLGMTQIAADQRLIYNVLFTHPEELEKDYAMGTSLLAKRNWAARLFHHSERQTEEQHSAS
ncbi:MAG: hypothetical protein JWO13_2746 [Acidobacteriales bacterium]|nr:hypothetical protein [Terriglobales bacterium]